MERPNKPFDVITTTSIDFADSGCLGHESIMVIDEKRRPPMATRLSDEEVQKLMGYYTRSATDRLNSATTPNHRQWGMEYQHTADALAELLELRGEKADREASEQTCTVATAHANVVSVGDHVVDANKKVDGSSPPSRSAV